MPREPFPDPGLEGNDRTEYRVRLKDGQTGIGHLATTVGQDRYVVSGEAWLDASDGGGRIEVVLERDGGVVRAASSLIEVLNGDAVVARDEGRFIGVRVLHFGGDFAAYPADVMPLFAVPLALRSGLRRGARHELQLWLANMLFWEVHARVERTERIEVPAGEHTAWRIRFKPYFGRVAGPLDRIVGMLLPPFVLHVDEQPPHAALRFEFPTGPFPWNPRALIEATSLG